MTPQSLSPCQASGVSRTRHPAGLHTHVPPGLRAVHGWTGEKMLSHSSDSTRAGLDCCRMIDADAGRSEGSMSGCGSFCAARCVLDSKRVIVVLYI